MEVLIALLISFGILSAEPSEKYCDEDIITLYRKHQDSIPQDQLKEESKEEDSEIAHIFDWGEEG